MSKQPQHRVISVSRDDLVNAGYIYFSRAKVARTEQLTESVLVDLDEYGIVVGVEVLNIHANIPLDDLVQKYHVHSNVKWFIDSMQAPARKSAGVDGQVAITTHSNSGNLVFA